ncbi:MAG TPA: hypothetical protein PLR26_02380 [Bacilli bacterium]|nr:hypothetical protein [Bacilli bacterium]
MIKMSQNELLLAYKSRKEKLRVWGEYLKENIEKCVKAEFENTIAFINGPRIKEEGSFIEKALFRKSSYSNPLFEITDQVGIRFIVSLLSDVNKIKKLILNSDMWISQCDRDFFQEMDARPNYFDYQSVHIICWPKSKICINNLEIDETFKCEIQIRSILQHAYAEISHQLIYKKPIAKLGNGLHRKMHRSIALMEVVDEYFVETNDCIKSETKFYDKIVIESISLCKKENIAYITIPKLNSRIINFIETIVSEQCCCVYDLSLISKDSCLVAKNIMSRNDSFLYQQPSLIVIIDLISKFPNIICHQWPFNKSYLETIYSFMGISVNN